MKLRIEILEEENQRLWAEVARLKEELEATNQVLMATKISIHQATEAALRWAIGHPGVTLAGYVEPDEHWITRGLAALLGEK